VNFKIKISCKKLLIGALCAALPIFCAKRPAYKQDSTLSDIKPPSLKERIEPFYPPEARAKGLQGSVQLSLLVTQLGMVEKAEITNSSSYEILDKAAQEYAKSLVFTPAERGGNAINVWLSWTVNYNLILYKYTFDLDVYVYTVLELLTDAEKVVRAAELNKIYDEILELHTEYINHIRQNPTSNSSKYLKMYLNPLIYQQWQVYLVEWPLTFIVMQDLLARFPQSEKVQSAEEMLITLAEEDVKRVLMLTDSATSRSLKLRDQFLKALHKFLQDNYPRYFNGYLKEVLEKHGMME
jgi:TonB family protein